MSRITPLSSIAVAAAALFAASAIAPAAAQDLEQRDPLEQVNRSVFSFNQTVETALLRPASRAYGTLPAGLQRGIDNFFSNLREPVVTVASALQGDGRNSAQSAGRFLVNSTVGIAGVFDVATPMGLVSRPEDLGLTLCRYGFDHGPYLVLPFAGPSSGRDLLGLGTAYALGYGLTGGNFVPFLALDGTVSYAADGPSMERELPDLYLLQREAYFGKRELACSGMAGPAELKASPFGQIKLRIAGLDPTAPAETETETLPDPLPEAEPELPVEPPAAEEAPAAPAEEAAEPATTG